jgi:hypothetical protein
VFVPVSRRTSAHEDLEHPAQLPTQTRRCVVCHRWCRSDVQPRHDLLTIPAKPVESEEHRQLREHRELLETAQPWARVDHRPYDPDLYARLIQTASYALDVPPVPSALSFDLAATVGLAANVARNTDDDTYRSLIAAAGQRHPLAIAVHLVRQLMFAEKARREELTTQARERATTLLHEQTWKTHRCG